MVHCVYAIHLTKHSGDGLDTDFGFGHVPRKNEKFGRVRWSPVIALHQ